MILFKVNEACKWGVSQRFDSFGIFLCFIYQISSLFYYCWNQYLRSIQETHESTNSWNEKSYQIFIITLVRLVWAFWENFVGKSLSFFLRIHFLSFVHENFFTIAFEWSKKRLLPKNKTWTLPAVHILRGCLLNIHPYPQYTWSVEELAIC